MKTLVQLNDECSMQCCSVLSILDIHTGLGTRDVSSLRWGIGILSISANIVAKIWVVVIELTINSMAAIAVVILHLQI